MGLCRRAIAHQEKRNVIRRAGPACKCLNGSKNGLLKLIQWRRVMAGQNVGKPGIAIHLVGVIGETTVTPSAEEHQRIVQFKFNIFRDVFGFGHQAHRKRALGVKLGHFSVTNQQRRRMARIEIFEVAARM